MASSSRPFCTPANITPGPLPRRSVHESSRNPTTDDQALIVSTLILADGQRVGAGATPLIGGCNDPVEAVLLGREDNARVQVVLADVVVYGQNLFLGRLQAEIGVELHAGHFQDVGVAGAH